MCELRGLEAHVKADENGPFGLLDRFEVLGRGLSGIPDILKSKRIGNDASPAVGAEFNRNVHRLNPCFGRGSQLRIIGHDCLVS